MACQAACGPHWQLLAPPTHNVPSKELSCELFTSGSRRVAASGRLAGCGLRTIRGRPPPWSCMPGVVYSMEDPQRVPVARKGQAPANGDLELSKLPHPASAEGQEASFRSGAAHGAPLLHDSRSPPERPRMPGGGDGALAGGRPCLPLDQPTYLTHYIHVLDCRAEHPTRTKTEGPRGKRCRQRELGGQHASRHWPECRSARGLPPARQGPQPPRSWPADLWRQVHALCRRCAVACRTPRLRVVRLGTTCFRCLACWPKASPA